MNAPFSRAEITAAAKAMREENLRTGRAATAWGQNSKRDAEERKLAEIALTAAYRTRKGLR